MANSILAKMAVLISGDTSGLNKGIKSATKELNTFEKTAKGIGTSLAAGIGAISFGLIAKQVIDVTANFQRFEAVLTNTLGSGSKAQAALGLIKDFASKTPFSVEQLTSSFVKLANQGFVPTRDELRKLGDLASSTGKEFDQLAEAIIDAQTGEFERLKEFGIRAKKQGDQVQFTFKGVQTQVKFTSAEIQKYVLSLGDLEGVSGAMSAISQTLGGKISNLGDAFDGLLLSLGNLTGGPLNATITGLTKLVNVITDLSGGQSDAAGTLDTMIKFLNSGNLSGETYAEALKQTAVQAAKLGVNLISLTDDVTGLTKVLIDPRTKINIAPPEVVQPQITTIQTLTDEIKKKNLEFETTDINDKKELANIQREIAARNAQIAKIRELTLEKQKLSAFGQKEQARADKGELIPTKVDEGFTRTLDKQVGTEDLFPTELPAPDVSLLMNNLQMATGAVIALKDAYGQVGGQAITTADQQILAAKQIAEAEARKGEMYNQVAGIFGDTVGQVLSGQQTLVQGIKSAAAKLLPIFLSQALAGTIAGAGKTTAPPPVIVALAAAGVAAVSALFRSATGHGGGGGSGGGMKGSNLTNVSKFSPTTSGQAQPQQFEFVLHGDDLVASQTTQLNRNLRLGR